MFFSVSGDIFDNWPDAIFEMAAEWDWRYSLYCTVEDLVKLQDRIERIQRRINQAEAKYAVFRFDPQPTMHAHLAKVEERNNLLDYKNNLARSLELMRLRVSVLWTSWDITHDRAPIFHMPGRALPILPLVPCREHKAIEQYIDTLQGRLNSDEDLNVVERGRIERSLVIANQDLVVLRERRLVFGLCVYRKYFDSKPQEEHLLQYGIKLREKHLLGVMMRYVGFPNPHSPPARPPVAPKPARPVLDKIEEAHRQLDAVEETLERAAELAKRRRK